MRMLKLKMRANHLQKKVGETLQRTSTFSKDWVECEENLVRLSTEVQQGDFEEAATQIDVKWQALPEEQGQAQMTDCGVGEAAAAVCVNIQLLDGVGPEAEGELIALYDQLYDMANGDEAMEELKDQFMLAGKPSLYGHIILDSTPSYYHVWTHNPRFYSLLLPYTDT